MTHADTVSGPYDVIVRTETSGFEEVSGRILRLIQDIDGVTRTLTCAVVGSAELDPVSELAAVSG